MRQRYDGDVQYIRVCSQNRLDMDARYVLTTTDNRVLRAPNYIRESVVIKSADVAGQDPSPGVTDRRGVTQVTTRCAGRPRSDFPCATCILVTQYDLDSGQWFADAPWPAFEV